MRFFDIYSCVGICYLYRSFGVGRLLEFFSLVIIYIVISFIQIYYIRYNIFFIIFVSMIYLNLQLCVSLLQLMYVYIVLYSIFFFLVVLGVILVQFYDYSFILSCSFNNGDMVFLFSFIFKCFIYFNFEFLRI